MEFSFPPGFLLGTASAAAQIEGGQVDSSWHDWYRQGRIADGSDPAVANDHWNRWQEDVDLMADMGLTICRMGVDWARLVPQEGRPDPAALAHYRQELSYMKSRGIQPLLTLHHFADPMWFQRKGGFSKKENLHYYIELVELTVRGLGDLVSDYITVNEPNVYAFNGCLFGSWPPGHKSLSETLTVLSNLAWCHVAAYGRIHALRRELGYADTRVGAANHLRAFSPADGKNPWHRFCATVGETLFQTLVCRAMCRGEFKFPLRSPYPVKPGEYADFHGVNYYTRSTVSGLKDGVAAHCPHTDLGWEIYPAGLISCGEKLYRLLPRPLWVTENGVCDNRDSYRARYLCEHLQAISSSGLPFQRYYHWCFCDNFEWVEGQSARFGLVHIDYDSQQRQVKRSGRFYSAMAAAGGVTAALYDEYVRGEEYPTA